MYLEDIKKKAMRSIPLKQQVAKVGMWIEEALEQNREIHAVKHGLRAVPLCDSAMDSPEISWAGGLSFKIFLDYLGEFTKP